MRVALDAGHGLNTAGKRTPDGMHEWSFNSVVASYISDELKGYENVYILRVDDITGTIDVPLSTRTIKANSWRANAYISIHANAFGTGDWNTASGIETFVHTEASKESSVLAKLVQEELIKSTKRSDRGIKSANFAVLRTTNMPAILVECGFMTNKEEATLLKSDAYRKVCAAAIVKGLAGMYGLKKKAIPKPIAVKKEEPFMLDKAIVINSFSDYPAVERLAKKLSCPIYLRETAVKSHQAKELIVCGGFAGKLKASKITDLSGQTLFDTYANIGKKI